MNASLSFVHFQSSLFGGFAVAPTPKGTTLILTLNKQINIQVVFETNSLWSIEAVKSLREELWNCTIVGHATACIGQFDNRNSNLLTCLIMWHSNRLSLDYFICKKVMLRLFLFNHVFIILLTYNRDMSSSRNVGPNQRDRRWRALLKHQNFDFLFFLGWSGCFTQSKHNIMKVAQS